MRLYLMCGGSEGQGVINDLNDMQDSLLVIGFPENEISSKIIPGGQHNENLWRQDFGEAYLWLFGSYASGILTPPETHNIRLFPNPTRGKLHLPDDFPESCDSLEILDMRGKIVSRQTHFEGKQINVAKLPPGIYIVSLNSNGTYYQGKFVKE